MALCGLRNTVSWKNSVLCRGVFGFGKRSPGQTWPSDLVVPERFRSPEDRGRESRSLPPPGAGILADPPPLSPQAQGSVGLGGEDLGRTWGGGPPHLCSCDTKLCGPSSMFRSPFPQRLGPGGADPLRAAWPDGLGPGATLEVPDRSPRVRAGTPQLT